MRPFFTYMGGKWQLAKHYGPPRCDVVIEPFAGSAGYSVYWNVEKAILADKSDYVCGVWDYLIKATEKDINQLPNDIEDGTLVDEAISQEARWLIGFWSGKGLSVPAKTPRAWYKKYRGGDCKVWGPAVKDRIKRQLPLIRNWEIRQCSYEDLDGIKGHWFIDPPYQKREKLYPHCSAMIDYKTLKSFCYSQKSIIHVCENEEATWLDVNFLKEVRITNKGRYRHKAGGTSKEAILIIDHRSQDEVKKFLTKNWTLASGFLKPDQLLRL